MRTCAGCNCDKALLWLIDLGAAARDSIGDEGLAFGVHLSAVGVDSELVANRDRLLLGGDFNPAVVGVDCRRGDGDAGDSGRRKGEPR